jgi:hypothetical protein
MQSGFPPSHLWAWRDPEFRAQLRPRVILETYDCGYILVMEVRPDGVIQGNAAAPPSAPAGREHLWTWDALERLECIIWSPAEPTR